ncbi:uncharacterized protein PRCAT00001706001 [Priceomyces carsonii]|uniref:uncharacterized protein n=1 Tax=Priceomyces carsonii TaxID=28549 RepID=UPI002ED77F79|nr:unnamed protein product [Priceomyces carsonii]
MENVEVDSEKRSHKSYDAIQVDNYVVIRLPSEGMKIVELRKDGVISLGKFGTFEVNGVLGFPFGQSFEILDDNKVSPIKSLSEDISKELNDNTITKDDLTKIFSSAESNQNIIDVGSKIQKLTTEDIDNLKKSGASSKVGQLIIEQIIAGHGSFDKKTIYSQQKYIKRKQQKFSRKFTIEYLGASQLLQYYIEKDLTRVLDMSEETLGLLLTYANVRPGGKYLLIDETGGVILYSMMERMKCEGTIVCIHENEHPNHVALKYSNYPSEDQERLIKTINWLQFLEPQNEKIDWKEASEEELSEMKSSKKAQYYRRAKRANEINDVIDMVVEGNFDALICVSTLYLPTLIPKTLKAVGGSRPVVIYSQFKEILLEAQHSFESEKKILAPSIFETRVRPYQTIIGRMHPVMSQKGYGGYVLSGTRVYPKNCGVTAVGRGSGKRKDKTLVKDE